MEGKGITEERVGNMGARLEYYEEIIAEDGYGNLYVVDEVGNIQYTN